MSRLAPTGVGFTPVAEAGIAESAAAFGISAHEVKVIARAGLNAVLATTRITLGLRQPIAGFTAVRLVHRWTTGGRQRVVISVQREDGTTLTVRARGPERQRELFGGTCRLWIVSDVEWWCSKSCDLRRSSWAA